MFDNTPVPILNRVCILLFSKSNMDPNFGGPDDYLNFSVQIGRGDELDDAIFFKRSSGRIVVPYLYKYIDSFKMAEDGRPSGEGARVHVLGRADMQPTCNTIACPTGIRGIPQFKGIWCTFDVEYICLNIVRKENGGVVDVRMDGGRKVLRS